jgi:hypothetical protein
MDKGLAELLGHELARRASPSFGSCASCRFWRADRQPDDAKGPHLCMLFDESISASESTQICISHEYTKAQA